MNDFNRAIARPLAPAEFIASLDRAATRKTTANGTSEIVWRIWGRGEPLLLLHGGTGSWLHWIRNIETLARDFMVIVPDLPGSGESGMPQPPISAETIAASLRLGLAAIIGAEKGFAVAGFSMGGLIAGYLASQSESRVERLVLVGSSGMEGARAPMEPLVSWRRLASDEEKRAVHRKNLAVEGYFGIFEYSVVFSIV